MLLCVSFSLTNQVWNYFEYCLCKTYFVFEFLMGEWLKILILGKLGFKTCVLEKYFTSYSCIFISYLQCFEVCFQKSGYFFKKMFFQIFDWSNLFFNQSKSFLKFFGELLSGSIDQNCFLINQTSWIRFFKTWILTFSKALFQKFFKFSLSISPIQTWLHLRFLSFFIFPFARFLSPNIDKTLLPFFFFFHISCIFMHFNLGISNLYNFCSFCCFKPNFV